MGEIIVNDTEEQLCPWRETLRLGVPACMLVWASAINMQRPDPQTLRVKEEFHRSAIQDQEKFLTLVLYCSEEEKPPREKDEKSAWTVDKSEKWFKDETIT